MDKLVKASENLAGSGIASPTAPSPAARLGDLPACASGQAAGAGEVIISEAARIMTAGGGEVIVRMLLKFVIASEPRIVNVPSRRTWRIEAVSIERRTSRIMSRVSRNSTATIAP